MWYTLYAVSLSLTRNEACFYEIAKILYHVLVVSTVISWYKFQTFMY